MFRETGHLKLVSTKRNIKVVLGMTCLLIIIIVCGCIFKSLQPKQREREEIAQLFQAYQPYGLVYNEEKNRLYYNGELVRYFEDIISAEHYIKWPDRNGEVDVYAERIGHFFGPFEDSTIKVYAVRDKHGDITDLDVDTGIQ